MDSQTQADTKGYSEPPKTELIAGKVYAMAAGSYKHAQATASIIGILSNYLRGKPCRYFTSELDIYLDEDNNFRPDVSVICDFSKMKDDGYYGAPTLVVEVLSPTTAMRDRGKKFDCYEKYGVKELWFINPEYETIEQYVLTDGAFKIQAIYFRPGTFFKSGAFEDLEISLDEVFNFYRLDSE